MTGTKRINKVTGKFVAMIKELKLGVKEVQGQIDSNYVLISSLNAQNNTLSDTCSIAKSLSDGLSKLIKG